MNQRKAAHREAIQKARYLFMERRQIPDWLPVPLVHSWRRCAELGVPPDRPDDLRPLVRMELQLARERSSTLLRLAELELDALAECISDAPAWCC
jgi:transcriptional regulator of acetoin/glycerol metabolism